MYSAIKSKTDFSERELEILDFWNKENIFRQSIDNRSKENTFFFYDGPPFATGMPHYGHILAGVIKDVIPRYQAMLGKRVERRFGWDCHGLPVETEAEKELKLKGRTDIQEMGIDRFNEYCRGIVLRYSEEWKQSVRRMGRWVDLDHDYKTMDKDFMESVWWVFQQLWKKDLIYLSSKVVPYSPALNTPLSNFEVSLAYKNVPDPSITVFFQSAEEEDTYFLSWTTTPWTLPSNLALTVSPDIEYSVIQLGERKLILANGAVAKYFKGDEIKILKTMPGKALEKHRYHPLFPYLAEFGEKAFFITLGDYVDDSVGTGIVHTAPMYGEDDFATGKKYGLPNAGLIDESGNFNKMAPDLAGMFFKDADQVIMNRLKNENNLFRRETIQHSYPFCWRSGVPLMYRQIPSWYVKVEQIKANLIQNNAQVHWMPESIKNGRMGKWLEGARDWAVSRNRYWGTPIPVWICQECSHKICLGSIAELEEKTGTEIKDLHSHFIDHLSVSCPECKGSMKRTEEVLDCWFESGSMPYAQEHYPFENKEKFDAAFPADFISEGLDQTRGWFYTLAVLSAGLFEKQAFRNVIVSGMLLAEDGKKMSKSLQNYPDPQEIFDKYGADAIRLYLLNSNAIKAEELKFSETGLRETMRNNIIPFWNALSFFTTYASIDKWENVPLKSTDQLTHRLDLWVMSQLHSLIASVRQSMDNYDLNRSVIPLVGFIDSLTNWYIRRSRRRFWKSDQAQDKAEAYLTLHHVLLNLSQLVAPFIPFIAETIYRVLKFPEQPISVHLCDYPEVDSAWINEDLNQEMGLVINAVSMGRALRVKSNVKIRQPLQSLTLVSKKSYARKVIAEMSDLIQEELNVKEVLLSEKEESLVNFKARPNLPKLGPKYGKQMRTVHAIINSLKSEEIASIIDTELSLKKEQDGVTIELREEDLLIDRVPKNDVLIESQGPLTLALNTRITEALEAEGIAREMVNRIQQTRKEMDLYVADRIKVVYSGDSFTQNALELNKNYIAQETLAEEFIFSTDELPKSTKAELNGRLIRFSIHQYQKQP